MWSMFTVAAMPGTRYSVCRKRERFGKSSIRLRLHLKCPKYTASKRNERGEKPPVRLGGLLARQPCPLSEVAFHAVQRCEQAVEGALIRRLPSGEAAAVHAVVDVVVDKGIGLVDPRTQGDWIEIDIVAGEGGKGLVEHAQDLARFVADDGARLLVPERRHQDPAGVLGVGRGIELVQILEAVQVVRQRVAEAPTLRHDRLDHRYRDRVLQPLQHPRDECAVRPGAGKRHVQVVAPGFGSETARAVGGDPTAEPRAGAHELARGLARVVPALVPLPGFQITAHASPFAVSSPIAIPALGANGRRVRSDHICLWSLHPAKADYPPCDICTGAGGSGCPPGPAVKVSGEIASCWPTPGLLQSHTPPGKVARSRASCELVNGTGA